MKITLLISLLFYCFVQACNTNVKQATENQQHTTNTVNNEKIGGIKNLSANEFAQILASEPTALLLDVRTPKEYAQGHIKNALLMNIYDAQFEENISKLDKTKPVLVYCAAGGRSADAAQQLQQKGFARIYNLEQGFSDWEDAKMEVEK